MANKKALETKQEEDMILKGQREARLLYCTYLLVQQTATNNHNLIRNTRGLMQLFYWKQFCNRARSLALIFATPLLGSHEDIRVITES